MGFYKSIINYVSVYNEHFSHFLLKFINLGFRYKDPSDLTNKFTRSPVTLLNRGSTVIISVCSHMHNPVVNQNDIGKNHKINFFVLFFSS